LDLPLGLPVVAPLPRPRPPLDEAGRPLPPSLPTNPEAEARHAACLVRLAGLAEAEPEPPAIGKPGCETGELVRLVAFRLPDGSRVAVHGPGLQAPTRLRCSMVEVLAQWVREDVAPLAVAAGGHLTGLVVDSSYECRPRNRIIGAKMSEHGTGNAIDIRGLSLPGGRTVGLTDPAADKPLRTKLQAAACARFMTVLGPGSDGYHETHVHLDLAERRNGMRLCKWEVRDPSWKPPAKPGPAKPAAPAPEAEPDAPEPDAAAGPAEE
ncbi:extensin family protein, partial [Rhodoplanes roseus]